MYRINPMHRTTEPLAWAGPILFIHVKIFVADVEADG
jgi:hypothetical protein